MIEAIKAFFRTGSQKPVPTKRVLKMIEGGPVVRYIDNQGREVIEFTGNFDVDCDGIGGNPFKDPCFQPDTRLHSNGKALWAERVAYGVVPPCVIKGSDGIVMGCLMVCDNLENGKSEPCVVGDSGPTEKDGEGSPLLASRLGLDPNPNHGGTDRRIIRYRVYPGIPAKIDGITYDLQPS